MNLQKETTRDEGPIQMQIFSQGFGRVYLTLA